MNPADVSDIDFRHNKRCSTDSTNLIKSKCPRLKSIKKPRLKGEMNTFFDKLNKAKAKPAILRITMPYAKEFVPKQSSDNFPIPFYELYNPDKLSCDYVQLLRECEKVFKELKVKIC